ncbi:hypothetical protein KC727_01500 [Candidatus Kaiserbacteria bacterium]|nr:hypothetical protein [Candidatus Kaiserbacteria bacterium]
MFDFYEKRKLRNILYSKWVVALLVLFIVLLAISTFRRFSVEREMAEKRFQKEQELELLKQRAALLEEKVGHMQNERGVEEELRQRFDVAKEGEQVIILLDNGKSSEAASPMPDDVSEEKGLFDFLKFW